jgi:hypothetical protein
MVSRRVVCNGALVLGLALLGGCGGGGAASRFRDSVGDVKGADGPDLALVTVSHDDTSVGFSVRFAKAPPLGASAAEEWVDMLLIGIDVPPIGLDPTPTGWRGVDYVLGLHGPQTEVVFRKMSSTGVDRLPLDVEDDTLSFSVLRAELGDPARFKFTVAAGREAEDVEQGSEDYAPAEGTFAYELAD